MAKGMQKNMRKAMRAARKAMKSTPGGKSTPMRKAIWARRGWIPPAWFRLWLSDEPPAMKGMNRGVAMKGMRKAMR